MRRKALALIVVMSMIASAACAEVLEIIGGAGNLLTVNETAIVEDVAEFRVGEPVIVDRIEQTGEESGEKHEFLVVPVNLLNLGFDAITFRDTIQASVSYREKYVFLPEGVTENPEEEPVEGDAGSFFLGKWSGRMNLEGKDERNVTLEILTQTDVNSYEGILSYGPSEGNENVPIGSYTVSVVYDPALEMIRMEGMEWIQQPLGRSFFNPTFLYVGGAAIAGNLSSFDFMVVKDTDSAMSYDATELEMLVEDTCRYVFRLPNVVVGAQGERTLTLTVADVDFVLEF